MLNPDSYKILFRKLNTGYHHLVSSILNTAFKDKYAIYNQIISYFFYKVPKWQNYQLILLDDTVTSLQLLLLPTKFK